jgi:hypothetical protein
MRVDGWMKSVSNRTKPHPRKRRKGGMDYGTTTLHDRTLPGGAGFHGRLFIQCDWWYIAQCTPGLCVPKRCVTKGGYTCTNVPNFSSGKLYPCIRKVEVYYKN